MPICKNNLKKSYTGNEPSPKGLGFCASGEKNGVEMKGKDGNMWIKSNGKWVKKSDDKDKKLLFKKLYNWWRKLANGNIIIISQDNSSKLIKSTMKTSKAQTTDILKKWEEFSNDTNIKAIIWSAPSSDEIDNFIEYLIKKSKNKLGELLQIKNLPAYLIENYKKYFIKYNFISSKDYTFKP